MPPHDHDHEHKVFELDGVKCQVCPHMRFVVAVKPPYSDAWYPKLVTDDASAPTAVSLYYIALNPGRGFRKRVGVCNQDGVGAVLVEEEL